ncbi:hypothetical protein JL722_14902 [Aureococcus anophagefferens]|nr:hypothetical protein JL722_14902 [Aureococcus anophagefferens]
MSADADAAGDDTPKAEETHEPNMTLAQQVFRQGREPTPELEKEIRATIEKGEMGPYYEHVCAKFGWPVDAALLEGMKAKNARSSRRSVYESVFMIINRSMEEAAAKLISGVATFTCVELCTYPEFVLRGRHEPAEHVAPELKKKVIDGPEVLQIIKQIPHLTDLLDDRYFRATRYLVRELRVLVYTQFLDAYKTVTLASMAEAFGVDKVAMVVETNRPDYKSPKYQQIIKQGDILLNRIQQLARCVSI